jgi:hypothetical protein
LKITNPHAGPGYRCPTCDKIYDSSLQKLPTVINKSKPTMTQASNNEPIIMFLDEHAGGIERGEDEYAKYDALFDGDNDEHKRMEGWKIVESKLELRDRQGNNRTLFKRDMDHMSINR